jgi:hypothetical protein
VEINVSDETREFALTRLPFQRTLSIAATLPALPPRWDWPTRLEIRLFRAEAEAILQTPPAVPGK